MRPQDSSSFPHHTFMCHTLELLSQILSPSPNPTSRPQMQAGHLQEALPDSYPRPSPGCSHGTPISAWWELPRQSTHEDEVGGVILTLQLPPLAQGFPSQGPGPGMRHPVAAEDGPLELRQLLVETGTVQRDPVQPSRHRHSSGCSQKPWSGLQPARHAAVWGGEAEGRNTNEGRVSKIGIEKFLRVFCAPPGFVLATDNLLG